MAKPGPKKGTRPSGRRPGSRNKATIEKMEHAERAIIAAQKAGRKLPKEMLYDAAEYFGGMMAHFQPSRASYVNPHNQKGEGDQYFWRAASMHIECAHKAAEFYSPRLKATAIAVTPGPPPAATIDHPGQGGNVVKLNDVNRAAEIYQRLTKKPAA